MNPSLDDLLDDLLSNYPPFKTDRYGPISLDSEKITAARAALHAYVKEQATVAEKDADDLRDMLDVRCRELRKAEAERDALKRAQEQTSWKLQDAQRAIEGGQRDLLLYAKERDEARAERDRLADAIREHRKQKADDRCIEDDDRLYEALGDGIKCDRSVGSKEEMLKNCARFIENRCTGGRWETYAQLEAERDALRANMTLLEAASASIRDTLEALKRSVASQGEVLRQLHGKTTPRGDL